LIAALHCGLARAIGKGLGVNKGANAHVNEIALELRKLVRQALMPSRDWIGTQPLAS